MGTIVIDKNKFQLGLLISFAFTAIYPIGLFYSMPSEDAIYILKHELSWSVFSVIFIPVGFGLMCSVLSKNVFSSIDKTMKLSFGALYFVLIIAIIAGVSNDVDKFPNPERISEKIHNGINFQERAILIDRCIRDNNTCGDIKIKKSFEDIQNCIKKDPDIVNKQTLEEMKKAEKQTKHGNFKKFQDKLSYKCALNKVVKESGVLIVPSSIMKNIAIIMNFVLVLYFLSFVFLSGIYFLYGRQSIGKQAIHILLGSLIILISWFPFRLYAVWHEWYYNLYLLNFYGAFWVLLIFASGLSILYLTWTIIVNLDVNTFIAIPSVYAAIVTIIGVLAKFNSELLPSIFNAYTEAHWSSLLALGGGGIFFIIIYTKSLLDQE